MTAWLRRPAGAVVFAGAVLLLSNLPGTLAFRLQPDIAERIGLTRVDLPPWVFVAVWAVIHAGMGVAAWALWRLRGTPGVDARVPLVVLAAAFVQTNLFWLSDGLRSVAVADATGLLLAATTVWVVRRTSPVSAAWLLPWLVWMPITLGIKLAALA